MQKQYVVGFAFNPSRSHVALIRKNRPEWQAGRLNGIGGKVEPGEPFRDAMSREFWEETGVGTRPEDWEHIHVMESQNSIIYVYRTVLPDLGLLEDKTDEKIVIVGTEYYHMLAQQGVPNILWLTQYAKRENVMSGHTVWVSDAAAAGSTVDNPTATL